MVDIIEFAGRYSTRYGYYRNVGHEKIFVCHRDDGPSYIGNNKNITLAWQVHGVFYERVRTYCQACGFDEETTLIWVLKYGDTLPRFKNQL